MSDILQRLHPCWQYLRKFIQSTCLHVSPTSAHTKFTIIPYSTSLVVLFFLMNCKCTRNDHLISHYLDKHMYLCIVRKKTPHIFMQTNNLTMVENGIYPVHLLKLATLLVKLFPFLRSKY